MMIFSDCVQTMRRRWRQSETSARDTISATWTYRGNADCTAFCRVQVTVWMYSMSTKNALQVLTEDLWSDLRSRRCTPSSLRKSLKLCDWSHRSAFSSAPWSRESRSLYLKVVKNDGSGPDHSPERIIGDRIVDVPMAIQRQIPTIQTIQQQWRFHEYSCLTEW